MYISMYSVGVDDEDAVINEDFGQKFIGVAEGGTLEIHGKDKKSWSMLANTVEAKTPKFQLGKDDQPARAGVIVYEFDRTTGSLIYESNSLNKGRVVAKHVLPELQESSVIVVVYR